MTTEPLDIDAIRANYAHPDRLMAASPILVHNLVAEVDRLQHQGQAEHITLLRTAVDRLTAALIERDTELTRLQAAEQRVRALHADVPDTARQGNWCACGWARPCPTTAALDGGLRPEDQP